MPNKIQPSSDEPIWGADSELKKEELSLRSEEMRRSEEHATIDYPVTYEQHDTQFKEWRYEKEEP